MRALNSASPMGWGRAGAGINPVWRGGEDGRPGGAVFLSGAAKGRCAAAEPPEAAF